MNKLFFLPGAIIFLILSTSVTSSVGSEDLIIKDGNGFKQELKLYDQAWVRYTYNKASSKIRVREERFWNSLKNHFKNNIDAFIIIDVSDWDYQTNGYLNVLHEEIGSSLVPAFVLYQNGEIVNSPYPVVITGAPPEKKIEDFISILKEIEQLKEQ